MIEKRKFVRIKVEAAADYRVIKASGIAKRVSIEDFSAEGAKFLSTETLQRGTLLEFNLNLPNHPRKIFAVGEVISQQEAQGNVLPTGIKFIQINPDDKNILFETIRNSTGTVEERRKFIRNPLSMQVKYAFLDRPDLKYTCSTSNISLGGMKLILNEKLLISSKIKLSFNLPDDPALISPEAIVLWIKQKEDGVFEAGIVFTKLNPSDRDRLMEYVKASKLGV